MSDTQHQYRYSLILDFTNYTPVANTILPELSKFGTLQSLADAAWIVYSCNPFIQELDDAPGNFLVKAV
jgi:hypothetical protein